MTMRPRPARLEESQHADGSAGAGEPEDLFKVPRRGFTLVRMIGRGGHGEIWEARQKTLGRLVAVKRLLPTLPEDRDQDGDHACDTAYLAQAFRQEALVTALLEHPNIVPVHDLGTDEEGRPLLAMKLVRGMPWDRMLSEDAERLTPSAFLARHLPILADVAQAVAFAHARGVVHRDLKPSQIMVGEFGETLLMDWGLAVAFDPEALARAGEPRRRGERLRPRNGGRNGEPESAIHFIPTLETASNPAGTPAYMAPEQTEPDASRIGPWTDVYLLGGILYYLLTGTPPHGTGNSRAAFERARKGVVEMPSERTSRRPVPAELASLAARALAPRPEDRLEGGARAFVRAIQDYLSGANRQRESESLIRQVASRLRSAYGDYEALSELNGMLDNARALWAENPSVRSLRERVLEEIVEAAVAHGDLNLARVHAARLEEGRTKRQLLAHIAAVEEAMRYRERQRRNAQAAVGVLILVLMIIAALDFHARRVDARERLEVAFERVATSQARSLVRAVARALDAVHATASLFAASEEVGPAEFVAFTRQILARQEEVKILEWVMRVPVNDRITFETAARSHGMRGFRIFELQEDGTTVPASLRPDYFPVVCAEPDDDPGNIAALGYDMASSANRWEAMQKARDTGKPHATGRVRLVQDPDGPFGFLVFMPVYEGRETPPTVAERREKLMGFVAAALRPIDLLEIAAGSARTASVAVDLYDDTAPFNKRHLVKRGSTPLDENGEVRSAIRHVALIDVGGRQWRFVATPTPDFLAESRASRYPWPLFAGAAVVIALAAYVLADMRESARITRLIQERDAGGR